MNSAGERLGVTRRQVNNLIRGGELRLTARGLVDEASVDRLVAARGGSHRRAWSHDTAWTAVTLLSDFDTDLIGQTQRSRLKARLRTLTAERLAERTRNRATVTRYRAHASAARHLADDVVSTIDASALGLADATTDVSGYVAATAVDAIIKRHGLIRDDNGTIALRVTTISLIHVRDLAAASVVLGALDLAESFNTRERTAALNALTRALERLR